MLSRVCSYYLMHAKRKNNNNMYDPVGNFHVRNGMKCLEAVLDVAAMRPLAHGAQEQGLSASIGLATRRSGLSMNLRLSW